MNNQPYIVYTSTSPFLRNLTFFGVVVVLLHVTTGKKYARYILKNKAVLVPPNEDWTVEEITLSGKLDKRVNGGQPIDAVKDEHGNLFYDVTEDI